MNHATLPEKEGIWSEVCRTKKNAGYLHIPLNVTLAIVLLALTVTTGWFVLKDREKTPFNPGPMHAASSDRQQPGNEWSQVLPDNAADGGIRVTPTTTTKQTFSHKSAATDAAGTGEEPYTVVVLETTPEYGYPLVISLHAYDSSERHTGLLFDALAHSDFLMSDESIPNSSSDFSSTAARMSLDISDDYRIEVIGHGRGEFGLKIIFGLLGDNPNAPVYEYFDYLEGTVTPSFRAYLSLPARPKIAPVLLIDLDGDGRIDEKREAVRK